MLLFDRQRSCCCCFCRRRGSTATWFHLLRAAAAAAAKQITSGDIDDDDGNHGRYPAPIFHHIYGSRRRTSLIIISRQTNAPQPVNQGSIVSLLQRESQ